MVSLYISDYLFPSFSKGGGGVVCITMSQLLYPLLPRTIAIFLPFIIIAIAPEIKR